MYSLNIPKCLDKIYKIVQNIYVSLHASFRVFLLGKYKFPAFPSEGHKNKRNMCVPENFDGSEFATHLKKLDGELEDNICDTSKYYKYSHKVKTYFMRYLLIKYSEYKDLNQETVTTDRRRNIDD